MPTVSDEFFLAALRMVEYLEDDEMEDFEQREANGESVDGHIYISVNKVRTDLLIEFDISDADAFEEELRSSREPPPEATIRQAWKEASANHPGYRPDELIPELGLALSHHGFRDVDMGRAIDVLAANGESA